MNRRLLRFLPLAAFLGIATFLGIGLYGDPKKLPSALIDKPVPEFELPPIEGRSSALGLASSDLKGGITIVNVFASWCVPCRIEHPFITALAEEGYDVHAINYKDKPEDAMKWLNALGDPYGRIGADQDGRVGVEWGVYGVPETFFINAEGKIVYKHVGPIHERDLKDKIRPILAELAS